MNGEASKNFSNFTTATSSGIYSMVATRNHRVQSHDDATWILTSAFIIFTMQSGFGLLESGSVSVKNEVNIMVKNAVDVIFGGLTYWMFGYGFSFGENKDYTNPFCGWGYFFVTADVEELGWVYSKFFFQASFATTATTIVSGAMAERTKLESYIIFSLLNTFVFCFPAHWVWGENGWLYSIGVVDIAGAGPVHLVGGLTGLVATLLLKPRHGRFENGHKPQMGSPTNAILGMFMLWWGWLGFNCGSTFGISGLKWKLAARSAVSTICASIAGGVVGLLLSYTFKNRKFLIDYMINGVLGALVGITALCALAQPTDGLIIGMVGALVTCGGDELLKKLKIDDPVGCVSTHAISGMWSLLSVGFFTKKDLLTPAIQLDNVRNGVFTGGGLHQLWIQAVAVISISVWTLVTSFVFLKIIDLAIGLRIPLEEELLGADIVEHGLGEVVYSKRLEKSRSADGSIEYGNQPTVTDRPSVLNVDMHRRCSRAFGSRHWISAQISPPRSPPPTGQASLWQTLRVYQMFRQQTNRNGGKTAATAKRGSAETGGGEDDAAASVASSSASSSSLFHAAGEAVFTVENELKGNRSRTDAAFFHAQPRPVSREVAGADDKRFAHVRVTYL